MDWLKDAIALIEALPGVMWAGLAVAAFVVLLPQIRAVVSRADQFEAFGVNVSLNALAAVEEAKQPAIMADTSAAGAAARAELRKHGGRLKDANILWVDDRPSNNAGEAEIFTALGAHVVFAASTDEAEQLLTARPRRFDLILSDWGRAGNENAGLEHLQMLRERGDATPMVFYTGRERDLPPGAQGLTTRPDRLVELVLDALKHRG
jgi:CheY-like chemotaxis protein